MNNVDLANIVFDKSNLGGVSKIQKTENQLSFKSSMKRDWEDALTEQLVAEKTLSADTGNISSDSDAGLFEGYQGVVEIQLAADESLKLAENNLSIINIQEKSQSVKLAIDSIVSATNSITNNNASINVTKLDVDVITKSVEEMALRSGSRKQITQLPEETNFHIFNDGEKIKIWLRQADITMQEALEIADYLKSHFKSEKLELLTFSLNGNAIRLDEDSDKNQSYYQLDNELNTVSETVSCLL